MERQPVPVLMASFSARPGLPPVQERLAILGPEASWGGRAALLAQKGKGETGPAYLTHSS